VALVKVSALVGFAVFSALASALELVAAFEE
jgi:hypothetical protein